MPTVTLVIDLQVDFFAHPRLVERRATIVANTNELAAMCREASVPVVWVRQEFAPDLSDATLEVKRGGIRVVIAGTPGAALLPELDAQLSDHFLVKKRYSAFFGTNLDELLRELGRDRLIIAGINTHACIRATVVDAYQRDLEVILAKECIDSHDPEHHEVSWRYMEGKLGQGLGNGEIRALLRT